LFWSRARAGVASTLWVNSRKARSEKIQSASRSTADIEQIGSKVSYGPKAEKLAAS